MDPIIIEAKDQGLTLQALSLREKNHAHLVLALLNGKLSELYKRVKTGDQVVFLETGTFDGYRAYQRSLAFLLIRAVDAIKTGETPIEVVVQYAINDGYYIELRGDIPLDASLVMAIKAKMRALIEGDLAFEKHTVHLDQARSIFHKQEMWDKLELFKYRKASNVNLYCLDGLYDYFYGYMVPSTRYLSCFDLFMYDEGLILQFMKRTEIGVPAQFKPDEKLFATLKESSKWGNIMAIYDVGSLNNHVAKGKANEMILVAEALMEKRIGNIADTIVSAINLKRFVFVAGPSSSGKTTFSHRLAIQLKAHGMTPHVISVDNYFVNREKTPKDSDGNFDFECLEAIDIERFNADMMALLAGQTVDMPTFNFVTGYPEYSGNYLTMGPNDLLIIEGIHCLNDKLSHSIPVENKFKIYISALTQLSVDDHNRIPTTDTRLIRRIVRDNQYRGMRAEKTILMWPSVRRGENNYIFPFQEQADIMFNSALVYELAVLKQYAEPLLFNVPMDSPAYIEAKRLIKFLDYFVTIPGEQIPLNSLIREFIGGSCFRD